MTQPSTKPPVKKPAQKFHFYPFWSPRFWHGLRFTEWIQLCVRHRFRIHPLRWPMAFLITLITPFNSVMSAVQRLRYGKQIDATVIEQPPVFILGHWRSGTTYLHELLELDSRFATPTTYQCFAPRHFLLTEWMMKTFGGWLLPRHRPMDNVTAGWTRPQEDEFALLTLAVPTPYERMAFPNDPPPHMEFLDMEGVAPADLQKFEMGLEGFVKALTFQSGKRALLKSPPHTGRIAFLSRLFPGAKFIHIVRDPYALFPSTVRLWKSLDEVQGLQMPRHKGLEEYVYECLTRMYRGFEKQRREIDPQNICDLRYEDLVQNPVAEVRRVYQELGLDDFEALRPTLDAYVGKQKPYQPNKHELDDEMKAEIRQRWREYFERYGY
ncbi:MAG: sulfotransferase family protein [Pirellulaceae bacterium]